MHAASSADYGDPVCGYPSGPIFCECAAEVDHHHHRAIRRQQCAGSAAASRTALTAHGEHEADGPTLHSNTSSTGGWSESCYLIMLQVAQWRKETLMPWPRHLVPQPAVVSIAACRQPPRRRHRVACPLAAAAASGADRTLLADRHASRGSLPGGSAAGEGAAACRSWRWSVSSRRRLRGGGAAAGPCVHVRSAAGAQAGPRQPGDARGHASAAARCECAGASVTHAPHRSSRSAKPHPDSLTAIRGVLHKALEYSSCGAHRNLPTQARPLHREELLMTCNMSSWTAPRLAHARGAPQRCFWMSWGSWTAREANQSATALASLTATAVL